MTDNEDRNDSAEEEAEVEEEEAVATWPVKGPATPQQAIVAIGFVFFLGIAIGILLCQTF
jgi:hypothetical protein